MHGESDFRIAWRRLKRQLAVWRVVAVVAVIAALLAALTPFSVVDTEAHIARLRVDGMIIDDADRTLALQEAIDDVAIQAVIVRIDSPGGTAYGGEALYHDLRRLAEAKPVIAVMGTLATSAAYMTALACHRIVARDATVTGSIGVILQSANVEMLLEKIGVRPHTVKSAPLKAQPNPVEPFTPEARDATEAVVADLYETFVRMVRDRRSLEMDTARSLADGRVFTGRQAFDAGLIDAIGGEVEARRWLEEEHGIVLSTPVRDLEIGDPEDRLLTLIVEGIQKVVFPEWVTLDGMVSVWHPAP